MKLIVGMRQFRVSAGQGLCYISWSKIINFMWHVTYKCKKKIIVNCQQKWDSLLTHDMYAV